MLDADRPVVRGSCVVGDVLVSYALHDGAIPPDDVPVGVDTDLLVVGNANEVERPVLEQRPLNAAAAGINAGTDAGCIGLDIVMGAGTSAWRSFHAPSRQ